MHAFKQVIDLGCGTGAIGNRIITRFELAHPSSLFRMAVGPKNPDVVGIDIHQGRMNECRFPTTQADVLKTKFKPEQEPTLVIMNPPFKHAMEFVEAGFS